MKKFGYFIASLIPVCVNVAVLVISSVIAAIVGRCIDMYKDTGSISLENVDIGSLLSESNGNARIFGIIIGSILSIIIFRIWIKTIKKGKGYKFKFDLSYSVVMFVFAAVSQIILYIHISKMSFDDLGLDYNLYGYSYNGLVANSNILAIALFIVFTAISEQLLCRNLVMHYASKISDKFFMVNIIQALVIAGFQGCILVGICSFVLGLIMGLFYKKAIS